MAGPVAAQDALSALGEITRDAAARRAGDTGERLLPVASALGALLSEAGLRRGTTVTVTGSASLLLTLLRGPSQAGAWCAVVGFAQLGLLAAAEAGVALERLALVPAPGPRWPVVVAALLDALDVVVVRPPDRSRPADGRRLAARARERGAVLVAAGRWEGADLRLSAVARHWEGIGAGHGQLRTCNLLVEVSGRGAAARPRRAWLSGSGHLSTVADPPAEAVAPVVAEIRPRRRPVGAA